MTEKRLLPGKSTSFFRKNIWKKNGVSVLLAIFLKNCSNLLDVGRPWRPNHSLIWETFLTPGTKLDTGMRRWIRWSCLWGALSNLSKKGINIYLNNVIFIHLNLKRGMCVYTQTHIHTYWLLLREMTSVKANVRTECRGELQGSLLSSDVSRVSRDWWISLLAYRRHSIYPVGSRGKPTSHD